ncbi:CrcB family protein [Ornithinibacillus gellani]|uniref:fluoride efflux transporter FluC n=1 Tax=Ornithinibacillus gellani TaxID=2293253 RepID=UPI000F45F54E|nr:CrcB family protein [Ornithinibacillus gellani]TQS74726.1 CrcB family protein [Ornithinibacillus gellani]
MTLLLIAVGGFFGSMTRYAIALRFQKHPIGTWIANVTGSILLGILAVSYQSDHISPWIWLLCGIGFCGSYTTFSTFGHESLLMLVEKKYAAAIGYMFTTTFVSIGTIFLIYYL